MYAYIDETGDEGFPKAPANFSSPLEYCCRQRHPNGPSPYLGIAAVLVFDTDRTHCTQSLRTAAGILFQNNSSQAIHWKNLVLEQKLAVAEAIATLPFKWVIAMSHKPTLPMSYPAPLLYNYLVRLLIERCDKEAQAESADLVLVFAHRKQTDYESLKKYIFGFVRPSRVVKIEIKQSNVNRLLQLADIVCGAFKDALYRNRYGMVNTDALRSIWPRCRSYQGKVWKIGVKCFEEYVDAHYPFAAAMYEAISKK